MTYNEYEKLCFTFRREVKGVRCRSPFQRRKSVDLMDLAKRMGDHRSSMVIVGCTHKTLRTWRGQCA